MFLAKYFLSPHLHYLKNISRMLRLRIVWSLLENLGKVHTSMGKSPLLAEQILSVLCVLQKNSHHKTDKGLSRR